MTVFQTQKILFDLDGTLVDTAADLHAATNHVLSVLGRDCVSLEQVRHMTGYGAARLIELGLKATGGTTGLDMDTLREYFLEYYRKNICVHSRLFEGCLAMLQSLQNQEFEMAVCTNKPISMALPLLEEIGIASFFRAVTGGDSFDFKKPDGRHLLATSAMLNGKGPVLMVGDSSPDINGAKSAGFPVVAVDFGYPDAPLPDLKPDYIISSLVDLPALLTYAET